MSGGGQTIFSFAFETSDRYVREWRRLDTAIEKAEAALYIAKEAKDTEAAAKAVETMTALQYEAQELNLTEARKGLEKNNRDLKDLDTYGLAFASRVMQLNVYQPLEAWERGGLD